MLYPIVSLYIVLLIYIFKIFYYSLISWQIAKHWQVKLAGTFRWAKAARESKKYYRNIYSCLYVYLYILYLLYLTAATITTAEQQQLEAGI